MKQKPILDVTAGSRSMHFNKQNELIHFNDLRSESLMLCDGRLLEVNPDTQFDFRKLPFANEIFHLVIFDPPHLTNVGKDSWLLSKYGQLDKETWKDDISKGFSECWRVLKPNGTLIFKWSENQVSVAQVEKLLTIKPICGTRRGKNGIFLVFFKDQD